MFKIYPLIGLIVILWISSCAKISIQQKEINEARIPADTSVSSEQQPIIIFMVDGLRPDRFKEAVQQGYMPHLKSLFYDQGAEVESYVSRSLTVPSWTTILTGFDQDETGVRGNSEPARVESGTIANFLDSRKDLTLLKYIKTGQSYRQLEKAHLQWIPSYFNKEETLLGFTPLNDGNYPPVADLIVDEIRHLDKSVYGIYPSYTKFDEGSARAIARGIKSNPGKYRYVMIWLTSIDESSHYNNDYLNSGHAYKDIDSGVGRILEAAEADPILKNAQLFLISDHGHKGGYDVGKQKATGGLFSKKVVNTSLNLTQYFAGDYAQAPGYHFRVGAAESPEPQFDLAYLKEFLIQPFSYTYEGKNGSPLKGRSIIVDDSGSSMAQVFLRNPVSNQWEIDQLGYYQLAHFKSAVVEGEKDLMSDLLSIKLKNLNTLDPELRTKITDQSNGSHPVQLVASILTGATSLISVDQLIPGMGNSTRAPVVVQSFREMKNCYGLILTKRNSEGEDEYRYLVMKNFSVDEKGQVNGQISRDSMDDPLGYLGTISSANGPLDSVWRSDREWLRLAKNTDTPTAIFSIVKSLTLAPRLAQEKNARSETPDFIVFSNRGFAFHGSDYQESDHGGLYPEEVKNSFFISGLGNRTPKAKFVIQGETLSRDFAPTVLDAAGKNADAHSTSGKSLFDLYKMNLKALNAGD